MDIIAKIFALGIIGAISTMLLNQMGKAGLAVILDIALIVTGLLIIYPKINELFKGVVSVFGGF